MNNHIHYISLYNLIEEYSNFNEKIIKSYIQLINQLSNTTDYDIDKFYKNLQLINQSGIINIAYINLPNSDDFIIVGSGTCYIEPKIIHGYMNVGHIEDIVVDTNFRGHGIAKNILDNLKKYAENKNCYKIILDCNEELVKLYSKYDYQLKGVQMAIYFN
jgi:glucosamine-phosphate N-acetyltransferase